MPRRLYGAYSRLSFLPSTRPASCHSTTARSRRARAAPPARHIPAAALSLSARAHLTCTTLAALRKAQIGTDGFSLLPSLYPSSLPNARTHARMHARTHARTHHRNGEHYEEATAPREASRATERRCSARFYARTAPTLLSFSLVVVIGVVIVVAVLPVVFPSLNGERERRLARAPYDVKSREGCGCGRRVEATHPALLPRARRTTPTPALIVEAS